MSNWLDLRFTKYKGRSLPEIIFLDPNWFFWSCEQKIFKANINEMLAYQADSLFKKSTHIKPPFIGKGRPIVQYFVNQRSGKFSHIKVVSDTIMPSELGGAPLLTKTVIDWSVPRNLSFYDRAGTESIVRQTKELFFGVDFHMSRARAEDFFDKDRNFDMTGVNSFI